MTNEHVKVSARFHEQGSVLRGDAEGFADSFEIEISLESTDSRREMCELVSQARRMCFTEKALVGIPLSVTVTVNGEWLPD